MKSLMFSTICWWIFTITFALFSALVYLFPHSPNIEVPGFLLMILWELSLPLAVLGSIFSYVFSKKQTRTASYFQLVLPVPILLWLFACRIRFLYLSVIELLLLFVLIGLLILATQQVKILRQKENKYQPEILSLFQAEGKASHPDKSNSKRKSANRQ